MLTTFIVVITYRWCWSFITHLSLMISPNTGIYGLLVRISKEFWTRKGNRNKEGNRDRQIDSDCRGIYLLKDFKKKSKETYFYIVVKYHQSTGNLLSWWEIWAVYTRPIIDTSKSSRHFVTTHEITDSDKDHLWMLQRLGEHVLRNRMFIQSSGSSRRWHYLKEGRKPLQWRNLVDSTLTQPLKIDTLTSRSCGCGTLRI